MSSLSAAKYTYCAVEAQIMLCCVAPTTPACRDPFVVRALAWQIVQARKFAEMEAARAEMMDALHKKYGDISEEEVARKIKQFLLRWINRKIMPAFKTWRDVMIAAKQERDKANLEAELAAMQAKLAAMGDNASLAKLKIYFAKKLGQMKQMCFKGLVVYAHQQKAIKMLDSEAGHRLKAFLRSKLESAGRKCWNAWLKHHQHIAEENMKNNEAAKKIAIMLEKLARSLVSRQFHAFIRLFRSAEEERAAEAALRERLNMMDELNKAKLRVFLDAKRLGKLSTFFKWWADVTRNAALYILQDQIDVEDAAIKALKDRVAEAQDIIGGNAANAHGLRAQLMEKEKEVKAAEIRVRDLEAELTRTNRRVQDAEADAKHEEDERKGDLARIRQLEKDLDAMYAARDNLAKELAGIAGEIGYVHNDSQF